MKNQELEDYIREWSQEKRQTPYQIKPRHILIEIMAVEEAPSQTIIGMEGNKIKGKQRIFPYGKVLDAGNCEVNEDDIAVLPQALAKVKKTEGMDKWEKEHSNERPHVPPPAKQFEGMLIDWQDKYHFPLDRFSDPSHMTKEDAFTFLIPEGFIDGSITEYDLIAIAKAANMVEETPIKIDPAMSALKKMQSQADKKGKIIMPQA